MQGKVEICGVNTARLPVLKNEEMMALLAPHQAGRHARPASGSSAAISGWCCRSSSAFSGRGENADDLFQVGCIGLIKAIDNFDIRQHGAVLHLRRSHDRGGDPPLSPG